MTVPAGPCLLPQCPGPHGAWNSPGPTWVCSSQDVHCHRAEAFTATKVPVTGGCCPVWGMHTLKKNPYPKRINFSRQNSAVMIRDSRGDIHRTPNTLPTHTGGVSPPFQSYHKGRAIPFTPREPWARANPGPWRDQNAGPHATPSSRSKLFIHTSRKRSSTWQEARVSSNAEKPSCLLQTLEYKEDENAWLHERQPETCFLTQPPAFSLGFWVLSH